MAKYLIFFFIINNLDLLPSVIDLHDGIDLVVLEVLYHSGYPKVDIVDFES